MNTEHNERDEPNEKRESDMKLRRSPTLEIGERIKAAKNQNKILWSLSTPNLPSYDDVLQTDPSWGRLTPPAGMPELIEHTKTALFNNWDQSKHEVIIAAGAKAALFAILKTITIPGDKVVLSSPTWPSYFDICSIADCKPIEMPTLFSNKFEMELDIIQQLYQQNRFKVIIFSNPNNPSGVIYDSLFLTGLIELAEKSGFYIIVDQSFSRIIFDEDKWSASHCRNSEKLFVVDSFSKNFLLQGARVSATLVPEAYAQNFTNIHQTLLSSAPAPAQIMALNAVQNNLVIPSLSKQKDVTRKFITAQKWSFVEQSGSFYYFPKTDNFSVLEEKAELRDVLLLGGRIFGSNYKEHFRLCFARPLSELEIIFNKLDEALNGK
ncbi:MAG: aminotransferase class I/II-fold pyridoxal phosphate-dependent enzyme [Alphaproteobacteria bacterium]|nr:aminotransferase class I/II-fold pyridoxal phosphate-dependent enzyme [Alphaproteobacteria bacterium]